MENRRDQIRVLSTLSLAASDTRKDTLTSIIFNTIIQNQFIKIDSLVGKIEELYHFEPYKEEVNDLFHELVDSGKIIRNVKDEYSLSEEEKNKLIDSDIKLRDQEKKRFHNFTNFIKENLNKELEEHQFNFLWAIFIEYLYLNFLEFGEEALKRFHPKYDSSHLNNKDGDFFQTAYSKLKDKDLCNIFKQVVEKFPDYASREDIDFLDDLAQKTMSFTSLGINPEMVDSTLDHKVIDWILYLDTNVLYSLLNLHYHPENEACKALIQLIIDNKQYIKITLRYSELTKKELNAKRDDFKLLDDKLTDSSIKAILRTENLDDFSRQFYLNLLSNRNSTLHPNKIIELAPNLLINKNIDISRNQKRVEKIGIEYLNTRIQDYRRFIDRKNEIRVEFCTEKKIPYFPAYRSDKQIIHDITLREIILDQRASISKDNSIRTFNTIKYFAATLDELLLDYDKSQISQYQDEHSFPVFFRPSFLLNKLVKVLPIKTSNYKKAFIKAVTSKGFNRDVHKSHDILKIVNYLKLQGIDNEDIIYNLISEDLFLENYRKIQNEKDFNQGEFIESELNRELLKKEYELRKTKDELKQKNQEAEKHKGKTENLETRKANLEGELGLYKNAIAQLRSEVEKLKRQSKLTDTQSQINFEAGDSKKEADKYKRKLKQQIENEIQRFKESNFKKWQKKVWYNLFWVIPFTVICIGIILFPSVVPSSTIDPTAIRLILSFLVLLIDGIFLYAIKMKYWDEKNKQTKKENIEVPSSLTEKLAELED
jgi:hypothetical protein